MIKNLFFSFVFLTSVLSISAQKEVYSVSKAKDSITISGIQGIYVNPYYILPLFPDFTNPLGLNIHINMGYFKEFKLGATTSLTLYGNIIGIKTPVFISNTVDINGNLINQNVVYGLGLSLDIEAEPRWYFDYKNRCENKRNTKLNSGWFVGLPTGIYTQPLTILFPLSLTLRTAGSFGYRYAFSTDFFMETSANLEMGLNDFIYLYYVPTPYLSLKAAYTFK